ncbi:MAG: DUF3868 domain-containing protein, partial [Muribaculaceae bacterium]|nr:DUF3868 domain-containing protein [Muribaculaceae bacterium]
LKAYISLLPLVTACLSGFQADAANILKVSDIKVARHDGELSVALGINPRSVNPGRDREVLFTPVVRSLDSADSLQLPQIRVAGRNRYYSHLRNDDLAEGEKVCHAGSRETLEYRCEVPFEEWMTRSRIDMREEVANCCDAPVPQGETPLALLDFEQKPFRPAHRYVALLSDSTIERSAEGRAFIDFIVNRTEIRPWYRGNTAELAKIIASIDKVKNDPDATITKVTIKGFASPEGSYSNNVRLAMGRTAALKEYVREHYDFDPEIMSTDYEPEDWAGLRAWVDRCTLPHRAELLEIIDSKMEPDPKDAEMKRRYPAEYKIILDSVYPALRHSDYTVKYRIRTFVDIEELKRVYASTPDRLRPVDFQRIAATYGADSPEYKEVFMTAVKVHPRDEAANLNAANITMERGDLNAAAAYLANAGDTPESVYARGVLAALTGDNARARALLQAASERGLDIAAEELANLDTLLSAPTVEYLIEPEGKR